MIVSSQDNCSRHDLLTYHIVRNFCGYKLLRTTMLKIEFYGDYFSPMVE